MSFILGMAETTLGGAIKLLQDFGFFDVILPFLLVFTIVFGILEKTRIFGVEKIGDREYPKKNINAMVAFVIAFFFITAKEMVSSIQTSLPIVSLILIAVVCFLMLVGSFASSKEEFNFFQLFAGWRAPLAIVFTIALAAIFMHSFGWLEPIYDYFNGRGSDMFVILVFVAIVTWVVYFVFNADNAPAAEAGK